MYARDAPRGSSSGLPRSDPSRGECTRSRRGAMPFPRRRRPRTSSPASWNAAATSTPAATPATTPPTPSRMGRMMRGWCHRRGRAVDVRSARARSTSPPRRRLSSLGSVTQLCDRETDDVPTGDASFFRCVGGENTPVCDAARRESGGEPRGEMTRSSGRATSAAHAHLPPDVESRDTSATPEAARSTARARLCRLLFHISGDLLFLHRLSSLLMLARRALALRYQCDSPNQRVADTSVATTEHSRVRCWRSSQGYTMGKQSERVVVGFQSIVGVTSITHRAPPRHFCQRRSVSYTIEPGLTSRDRT